VPFDQTPFESNAQTRQFESQRRKFRRPLPPSGLRLNAQGQIQWEASQDELAQNVTHYNLYGPTEATLLAQVPVQQHFIAVPFFSQRAFVSAFNSTSQLESIKVLYQGPVGVSSLNHLASGVSNSSVIQGNMSNLVEDPGFENLLNGPQGLTSLSWRFSDIAAAANPIDPPATITSMWSIVSDNTNSNSGNGVGKHAAYGAGSDRCWSNQKLTVNAGEQYYLQGFAKSGSVGTNGTMFLQICWYDRNGAFLSASSLSVAGGTASYTKLSGTFTAPANATQARVCWAPSGHSAAGTFWYVDDILLRAVIVIDFNGVTTNISNGAISTPFGSIPVSIQSLNDATGASIILTANPTGTGNLLAFTSKNGHPSIYMLTFDASGGPGNGNIEICDGTGAGGFSGTGETIALDGNLGKVMGKVLSANDPVGGNEVTIAGQALGAVPGGSIGSLAIKINGVTHHISVSA
jgi:hypothetical protein